MDDFQIVSSSKDDTILIWNFFGTRPAAPSQIQSQEQMTTAIDHTEEDSAARKDGDAQDTNRYDLASPSATLQFQKRAHHLTSAGIGSGNDEEEKSIPQGLATSGGLPIVVVTPDPGESPAEPSPALNTPPFKSQHKRRHKKSSMCCLTFE